MHPVTVNELKLLTSTVVKFMECGKLLYIYSEDVYRMKLGKRQHVWEKEKIRVEHARIGCSKGWQGRELQPNLCPNQKASTSTFRDHPIETKSMLLGEGTF